MLKEILKILEADARTSAKQIAAMTNTSSSEVSRTIKRAQKEQIILKYKAVINWDKVEDERVWALIEVRVTPQKDVGFDSIAERIYRFPQARSARPRLSLGTRPRQSSRPSTRTCITTSIRATCSAGRPTWVG